MDFIFHSLVQGKKETKYTKTGGYKMTNEQTSTDWREEYQDKLTTATLKIADREIVVGVFVDEGKKNHHPEYGDSIAFRFQKQEESEVKTWYVNPVNYDLLKQIKLLGPLTGLKVTITRHGKAKKDTRYFITKYQ